MRGLSKVVRGIADGLKPGGKDQIVLRWADDPDDWEPGSPVIRLTWGDEPGYYAPDVEGPDWLENRCKRLGS